MTLTDARRYEKLGYLPTDEQAWQVITRAGRPIGMLHRTPSRWWEGWDLPRSLRADGCRWDQAYKTRQAAAAAVAGKIPVPDDAEPEPEGAERDPFAWNTRLRCFDPFSPGSYRAEDDGTFLVAGARYWVGGDRTLWRQIETEVERLPHALNQLHACNLIYSDVVRRYREREKQRDDERRRRLRQQHPAE